MENNKADIEKILSSMDRLEKAQPRPFFYGRLQHKIEHKREDTLIRKWKFQLIAGMLIILLNAAAVYVSYQDNLQPLDDVDYLVEEYGFSTNYLESDY